MGTRQSSFRLLSVLICAAALLLLAACLGGLAESQTKQPAPEYWEPCGEQTPVTPDLIHAVRLVNRGLFRRQPNVWGVGEGIFSNENGERLDTIGIIVIVTEKVDQDTLPPEDRIPGCLNGVPVQIEEVSDEWCYRVKEFPHSSLLDCYYLRGKGDTHRGDEDSNKIPTPIPGLWLSDDYHWIDCPIKELEELIGIVSTPTYSLPHYTVVVTEC